MQPAAKVRIWVANPAAPGLAGFSGSTFIAAPYIAGWWGDAADPTIFFPFVALFGGPAQFCAGLLASFANDLLVTVINTVWGSLWMAIGLLYPLVTTGNDEPHSVLVHFRALASWFVVLIFFTWPGVVSAAAVDLLLTAVLFCLAVGSTIAICMFMYGGGVSAGMKAAAHFWIISAALAWLRIGIMLLEEQSGSILGGRFSWLWRRKRSASSHHEDDSEKRES